MTVCVVLCKRHVVNDGALFNRVPGAHLGSAFSLDSVTALRACHARRVSAQGRVVVGPARGGQTRKRVCVASAGVPPPGTAGAGGARSSALATHMITTE